MKPFRSRLNKLFRWLLTITANTQRNLALLLSGFGMAMLGLLIIIMAEYIFGQSFKQEILAAIGVFFLVVGLLVAAAGYISLSVLSLLRYLMHSSKHDNKPTETTTEVTPENPSSSKKNNASHSNDMQ